MKSSRWLLSLLGPTLNIYSEIQSRNLQLHDEQITNQKSDEGQLKIKTSRAKQRKSPYQASSASHQQTSQTHLQLHPATPSRDVSPTWPNSTSKWYPQAKSPAVLHSTPNHWNSYLSNRTAQTVHEQSPGGSNSSCQGDNSTGQHTPHENSPLGREDMACYWKRGNHCLFGTFDTAAQQTSEDFYKAAYGSYYQQLAASAAAARSYSHIPTPATKLTDFYYNSAYGRFPTPYSGQIPYSW